MNIYPPPNPYFNGINFNNKFFYNSYDDNNKYLPLTGGILLGAVFGTTISASYLSGITINAYGSIQSNGIDISTIYDTITARQIAIISLSNTLQTNINNNLIISSNYTDTKSNALSNTLMTAINTKQDILSFNSPMSKAGNAVSIDLSSYLTSSTASSTFLTIANANSVYQSNLTFNAPLSKTANTVSIDLTNYYTKADVNNISNLNNSYASNLSLNSSNYALNLSLNSSNYASNLTANLSNAVNTSNLKK